MDSYSSKQPTPRTGSVMGPSRLSHGAVLPVSTTAVAPRSAEHERRARSTGSDTARLGKVQKAPHFKFSNRTFGVNERGKREQPRIAARCALRQRQGAHAAQRCPQLSLPPALPTQRQRDSGGTASGELPGAAQRPRTVPSLPHLLRPRRPRRRPCPGGAPAPAPRSGPGGGRRKAGPPRGDRAWRGARTYRGGTRLLPAAAELRAALGATPPRRPAPLPASPGAAQVTPRSATPAAAPGRGAGRGASSAYGSAAGAGHTTSPGREGPAALLSATRGGAGRGARPPGGSPRPASSHLLPAGSSLLSAPARSALRSWIECGYGAGISVTSRAAVRYGGGPRAGEVRGDCSVLRVGPRLLLRSELRCGAAEPRARPAVGSRPAGPGVRGLRAALSPEPSALAGR